MFISIGKVAIILGVGVSTLRRWDNTGRLQADYKTIGKHRRYELTTIEKFVTNTNQKPTPTIKNTLKTAIVYCRVSGSKQKHDLETQQTYLENYMREQQWNQLKTFKDIGSGLKDTRKDLLRMIKELPVLRPTYLVISYQDRLARFGLAIIKQICQIFNVAIIITNIQESDLNPDQQLVADVLAMLTSFAGKVHRARRGKLSY